MTSVTVKQATEARDNGKSASAVVRGVNRGGSVYKGFFWFAASTSQGCFKVALSDVKLSA